jgi:molecular chaperone GrpE (heat shock protein)
MKFTAISEIKEDLKEINDILKKMQANIKLLENKCIHFEKINYIDINNEKEIGINMLNIEQNLENIKEYRPNWTDEDKTAYVDKLKYINENYDKLLAIHHALISNSLRTFDYLSDATAEFLLSYLRGK